MLFAGEPINIALLAFFLKLFDKELSMFLASLVTFFLGKFLVFNIVYAVRS